MESAYKIFEPQGGVKSVLIVLHGLASSKESYSTEVIANSILKDGVATVAFDLPNHGNNDTALTLDNCLGSIKCVLQFVESQYPSADINAMGSSFGAYLTLLFILKYYNPFKQIVLRCPAVTMGKSMKSAKRENMSAALKKLIDCAVTQSFYEELITNDLFEMDCVNVPITVIHGTDDKIVAFDVVKDYISRKLPNAELTVFENSGHSMRSETELKRTVEIIEALLNR